jgi:hypothetical protein
MICHFHRKKSLRAIANIVKQALADKGMTYYILQCDWLSSDRTQLLLAKPTDRKTQKKK